MKNKFIAKVHAIVKYFREWFEDIDQIDVMVVNAHRRVLQ